MWKKCIIIIEYCEKLHIIYGQNYQSIRKTEFMANADCLARQRFDKKSVLPEEVEINKITYHYQSAGHIHVTDGGDW